jgi:hypothetical protein
MREGAGDQFQQQTKYFPFKMDALHPLPSSAHEDYNKNICSIVKWGLTGGYRQAGLRSLLDWL